MEPGEIHPQILEELEAEGARPGAILFEKSWQPGEVPTGWKRGHTTLIPKRGAKKTQGTTEQSVP